MSLRRGATGSESPVGATVLLVGAVGLLLASLSLVTWRQSRALEVMTRLDSIRQERSLGEARRAALEEEIVELESRGRVTRDARIRLDMHNAHGDELVYLPGGGS
jgi:cell division protein FtsL